MATRLYKTVKPSGGDYTTLQACLDANKKDLRAGTGSDEYFDIEIDGSWSSADTTAATTAGFTTDATHYINIYTTATARHDGRAQSVSGGTNYRLILGASGAGNGITVKNDYVFIDGLEISGRGAAYNGSRGIYCDGTSASTNCVFKNNVIHDCYDTGYYDTGAGIVLYRGGLAYNNIIYNCGTNGITTASDYGSGIGLYNNTVYNYNLRNNSSVGLYVVGANNSTTNVKNNLVVAGANGGACFSIGSGTASNNAGSDTSGDVDNLTTSEFVSVTGGSQNLHLASGASSIDAGTSLAGVFTVDIDGATRSGTWDIGADEYDGGGAATGQPAFLRHMGRPFGVGGAQKTGFSRW